MMDQETRIAELAYKLWVERGSPEGSPEVDWNEAARQVLELLDSSIKGEDSGYDPYADDAIGAPATEKTADKRSEQPVTDLGENLSNGP